MSSSRNPRFGERAQGKREENRKKRRKAAKAHKQEPRQTETAPHILAALEAQRARVPQQQPPQQPRRTAIPGFVFDPERDRFFLSVKNPLGIPDRVRKTTPLSVGGTGVRGSNRRPADRSDSPAPVSGPAEGLPAAANRTNSAATRPARSWNTGGRGIHSFVMNRRKGFYGGYSPGAHCTFAGSSMGGVHRRAAVASIVSSSRFLVREDAVWGRSVSAGTDLSSIDWDAGRGVVAVGTRDGAIGTSLTPDPWYYCDVRDEHGGVEAVRDVDWGWTSTSGLHTQVSDIKFRTYGERAAFAAASLGCRGTPGGVSAVFLRRGVEEGMSADVISEKRVPHGSVWCTEWDPLDPRRLAVGPSSCCPVSFFDAERQTFSKIAQLKSDVFSISFLPPAAPGAGHVIICGLRDGSVILLDSREKPPQHQRPSTDGDNTSAGGSCGKNGGRGSRTLSHNRARGKKGSHHQQERNHLARMSSSVDHTHVLQDGTRCLARDRLGSLQTLDLRFPGRAGPLKVLVSPPATGALRARDRGKFALDPGEAVVATPVVASASTAVSEGGGVLMGGGERFLSSPRAWDAFSNAEIDRRGVVVDFHRCGSTGAAGGGVGGGGEGADTTTATTTAAAAGDDRRRLTGDRLQILSLSTGEVLTDIATPWTEMSLARGVVGPPGGGAGGCHGELQFWGKACESGQRTVVFEARLRSEGCGGFGRG